MSGALLAAAAEALVGTPFRLHGRVPGRGLDCVGLVLASLAATGREARAPAGYRLRQLDADRWLGLATSAGFAEAGGAGQPGDVLLVRCGPGQHHLLVTGAAGDFIHAHAGLGRVVRTPPPLPWPVLRRWRLLP